MNIYYVYWLFSVIGSYLLSVGFFGYGIDYYAIYHKSVWGYGHILDYIGMYLVGKHWQGVSLGIFAVSMLQYIVYFLLFRDYKKQVFWGVIAIILSFGWAHFMQSLNMLRQGLSINILLIFLLARKRNLLILMMHTVCHKISVITIPMILIFQIAKFNYFFLLFSRIVLTVLLSFVLPTLTTPVRGIDLTLLIVFVIMVSELYVLRDRRNFLTNKNTVLMLANTIIIYFLFNGMSTYAERVFLSFFPVYFFLLAAKVKLNAIAVCTIFCTACLYVSISWFVGPLMTLS